LYIDYFILKFYIIPGSALLIPDYYYLRMLCTISLYVYMMFWSLR